jgi:hypothetical protein
VKEIKWMLYTLYVAGYTSLIWATALNGGIKIGPNHVPIGLLLSGALTFANCYLIILYLKENWNKEKM